MSGVIRGRSRATPASASSAVAPQLTADPCAYDVLAVFPHAAYLRGPDATLALVTADGIAHPNAVVVTEPSTHRPFARLRPGDRVEVGDGHVTCDHLDVEVRRWWRPHPQLRPTGTARLTAGLDAADTYLAAAADPLPSELVGPLREVVAALRTGDRAGAVCRSRQLLGLGPGLTPSGDDVLAGVYAAAILLAPVAADGSLGPDEAGSPRAGSARAGADALVDAVTDVGAQVARHARHATTTISASLLHHAARGEVAAPAGEVLRALTGVGDLGAALDGLLRVGGTSGRDLTAGLLAGGRLAVTVVAAARVPA